MKKKQERFRLVQFRWLLMVNTIIVVGAVMAFGLVARLGLNMTESNALLMLAMVPPMIAAVAVSTTVTLRAIRKRMGTLMDGIQAVADGDLDVILDTKGSAEYQQVYAGFNRMTAELKNTKQEMRNFINEFSHEFKTPITSISGFAQLLMDTGEGIETPKRMEYLQVIADESLRLSTLSQNTLLLSKVDACEIITDKESYDLSEQIKRCVILLLPKIEQKKIQLELDVGEITYCGNAKLMEQVWVNLLSNAIKFTPENGEISVTAGQENGAIRLHFTDSGVGMDAETRANIFKKYYQHDTVSTVRQRHRPFHRRPHRDTLRRQHCCHKQAGGRKRFCNYAAPILTRALKICGFSMRGGKLRIAEILTNLRAQARQSEIFSPLTL